MRRSDLTWLLLRRKRLVEFLLSRLAGPVRPDHRLLPRICGFSRRRSAKRHSVLIDHRLHAIRVNSLIAVHLFLGRQLPIRHRHLRFELLDWAPSDGDAHEIVESARRRRAALKARNCPRIIAAHPDACGEAA